jgi:glycosyltransferase involved in cell wall biosynthesis
MVRPRVPPPPGRLRLLSVGPIPPEWGGRLRGGVTRFHATLLDELRTRPWRHRIEPIGVLIPPPQRVKRWRADRRAPLPIYMQPEGGRPRRFTGILLARLEPDVVLINNLAAFNGARFARIQAELAPTLPTAAVIHEWTAIRNKRGTERGARYLEATRSGLAAVDAVVFPSDHTRRVGREEFGLDYPSVAEVIPNPLQPAFADQDVRTDRDRRGVAFVGSFNPRKNPGAVLEAAAEIPGLEVVMQGRGPLEEDLRERVRALGIERRVVFPPYVAPPDHVAAVIGIMERAELVCLPSRSESFGLVMIEALAAGAPVVGYGPTLREIRERVGIDVGEPIDDPEPTALAAAIEAVRSREWDRAHLRRAALGEFSVRSVAQRYSRLLRRVS